MNFNDLD
jgi:hypothetical protein